MIKLTSYIIENMKIDSLHMYFKIFISNLDTKLKDYFFGLIGYLFYLEITFLKDKILIFIYNI